MRTGIFWIVALVLGLFAANISVAQTRELRPKNVIIMISDGCGYNHIAATGLFAHGKADAAVYHTFDVKLGMATFPENSSYEPDKAWEDFDYVRANATDSAAAATVLATGSKTLNGSIGVNAAGETIPNVIECAESLGKATGVVTSVPISHATPAGFVAHNPNRNNYAAIATEMLQRSEVDVIMGAGHPMFDRTGKAIVGNPDYKYAGGPETWEALMAGKAGAAVDADHNGIADDAWTLIEDREKFQALATGVAPKRVFGLAQVHKTLQQERVGDDNSQAGFPAGVPFIESVPTLAEMTAAALNVLDDDPDGLFLMIEGGAVDWAAHVKQSDRMIEEENDFNKAVEAVVKWIEAGDGWDNTLLIVTADHETGYLTVSESEAAPMPWACLPLTVEKAGDMPVMQWNSNNHTNSLVPLFANGVGSDRFMARVVGADPKRGPYIDNTAVAGVVFEMWQ